MDEEMIERCAQALSTAIENFRDTHKPGEVFEATDMVLAVIKAMREPTEAMKHAKDDQGDEIHWDYHCHICGGVADGWYAMIDSITGDKQ